VGGCAAVGGEAARLVLGQPGPGGAHGQSGYFMHEILDSRESCRGQLIAAERRDADRRALNR